MITIRRAGVCDTSGIARVHCQSHIETYRPIFGSDYTGSGFDQHEAHWRERLRLDDLAFVAVAGDEIVGFIHALEDAEDHATLTTLYLLQAWHHRGIGRALLTHMLDLLYKRGHRDVRFGCLPENAHAIAFYESQGARQLGRTVSHHAGKPHEDLLFSITPRPLIP